MLKIAEEYIQNMSSIIFFIFSSRKQSVFMIYFGVSYESVREESQNKNVTKSGKGPKEGEGVIKKNQKVQNSNLDFLIRGGVRLDFYFFPNVNVDFQCFS